MAQFDERLAEWWATPPYSGTFVETLTIEHPDLTDTIRIANSIAEDLQAFDEFGIPRTYIPVGFTVKESKIEDNTDQRFEFSVDGIDGRLYEELKKIDLTNFEQLGEVSIRIYINPDYLDKPLREPIPSFILRTAQITRKTVTFTCSPRTLPNKRNGYIYDIFEFPGTKVLQNG